MNAPEGLTRVAPTMSTEHRALEAAATGRWPLAPAVVEAIRAVPHLAAGSYRTLDVERTLGYYIRRFVAPLRPYRTVDKETVIADAGAGYGWLAMAFALASPARLIAAEPDGARLAAGREIARLLGIDHRIEWRAEALGRLSLPDKSADVVYAIEVVEHVHGEPAAIRDLGRLSRDLMVITTPNRLFPLIAHDTRLPFCHWLPLAARRAYARLCGRADRENDNRFWSAAELDRLLPEYRVASAFLHYPSIGDYLATLPRYLPYNGGTEVGRPGIAQRTYYRLAATLGGRSRHVLPNIAAVYRRRG